MTILIHTIPDDLHAAAVKVALKSKGIEAITWYTGDFPSQQELTVKLSGSESPRYSVLGKHHDIKSLDEISTVWHRRIPRFQRAPDVVDEFDAPFVTDEISNFLCTSIPLIGQDAFWVNDYAASQYADNKLVQLKAASRAGIGIPATIATNSPDELRAFVEEMGERKVIYKPFRGYNWTYADKRRTTYTKIFTLADLPADALLEACPGIYQEYTEKHVELRVTVMGKLCVTVALHSDDKEDWRVSSEMRKLRASKHKLPQIVEEQCLAIMSRLNLVFGCIDLILTPEGEYVFLEVNEMGQFLWVEYLVPDINLLENFCHFLASGDRDFSGSKSRTPILRSEIMKTDAFQLLAKQSREHVF